MGQGWVDRWSFVHAAVASLITAGLWALHLGWWSVLVVSGLEILWEIFENNDPGIALWNALDYTGYEGDSRSHTTVDIVITCSSSIAVSAVAYTHGAEVALISAGGLSAVAAVLFVVYKVT